VRAAGRHGGVEVQVEPVIYHQPAASDSQYTDLVVALEMELAEIILVQGSHSVLDGPACGVAVEAWSWRCCSMSRRREEHWLREKFPDYDEYAIKDRRLIPWLY
jgi:hypothetical protein